MRKLIRNKHANEPSSHLHLSWENWFITDMRMSPPITYTFHCKINIAAVTKHTYHARETALCFNVGAFKVVVGWPHWAVWAAVRAAGHGAAPWYQLGVQRLHTATSIRHYCPICYFLASLPSYGESGSLKCPRSVQVVLLNAPPPPPPPSPTPN